MKIIFYATLFFLFLSKPSISDLNQINGYCDYWKKSNLFNSTEMHSYNLSFPIIFIDTFNDLNLTEVCNLTINSNILKIYGRNMIMIETQFNLGSDFLNTFQIIYIQNIKGIDQKQNVLHEISFLYSKVYLINVNFEFYQNGNLITSRECLRSNFNEKTSYFGSIKYLSFLQDVFYTHKVCPLIFMNTDLVLLEINGISDSLIHINRLEFISLNDTLKTDLNIKSLSVLKITDLAYIKLDLKIIDPFVFGKIQVLSFTGIILAIQNEFFLYFKKIKLVVIAAENYFQFFHSGTKWINSLNKNLKVSVFD